jgi:hypothetical protein
MEHAGKRSGEMNSISVERRKLQLIRTGGWGKKQLKKTPFQIEGKGVETFEKEPIKLLSL